MRSPRRVSEIQRGPLPNLARYLEGKPEGEHEEWARRELVYIKERIREDG